MALSRLRTRLRALWHAVFTGPDTFLDTIRMQRAATELAYLRDSIARGSGRRRRTGAGEDAARQDHGRCAAGPSCSRRAGRLPRRCAGEAAGADRRYPPPSYPGPVGTRRKLPGSPTAARCAAGADCYPVLRGRSQLEASRRVSRAGGRRGQADPAAGGGADRSFATPWRPVQPRPGPARRGRAARPRSRRSSRQLDDYVLPRLAEVDAPLLAVVGGSTGAGKSTLVNSLLGREVSPPGVIRPTTRAPVLVHHSSDAHWFTGTRILPGLARSSGTERRRRALAATGRRREPAGRTGPARRPRHRLGGGREPRAGRPAAGGRRPLALRDLRRPVRRRRALGLPDLGRPAQRRRRGRAGPGAAAGDAGRAAAPGPADDRPRARRLAAVRRARDLRRPRPVCCPTRPSQPIRSWLATLAANQASRAAVVRQTLDGAIASLERRAPDVADALDRQAGRPRSTAGRGRPFLRRGRPYGAGADRGRHPAPRRGAGPLARVRRHR